MSDLRQRVEAELEGDMGVLSKILRRQFLDFDEVEKTATDLGYKFEYDSTVPMVIIKRGEPMIPNERFDIIPYNPYWLVEDGWYESYRGVLKDDPSLAHLEAIDIISPLKKELNLKVWYSKEEEGQEVYAWQGRIDSIQSMNDLLRKPPEA